MNLLNIGTDTTKIYTTTDYSIFGYILGNRDIVQNHVLNLAKLIKEKDLEVPIIVNEKMEVCDGQHRLEACKLVNKPVDYIIKEGLDLVSIRKLNSSSRKWTMEEYMMSFVKLGHKDYEILEWFFRTYKFGITESMAMLNGKGWSNSVDRNNFKIGIFKVDDLERAKTIAERIMYIGEFFQYFRKNSFVSAMISALYDPSFDWKIFEQRLLNNSAKLKNQGSRTDFTHNIETLYNHHTSPNKRIRLKTFFDTTNVGKSRAANGKFIN
tara:strand:+ start:2178 stop:2978 length:801 start_codon:yes stop_codon:yes gene_type:complete